MKIKFTELKSKLQKLTELSEQMLAKYVSLNFGFVWVKICSCSGKVKAQISLG